MKQYYKNRKVHIRYWSRDGNCIYVLYINKYINLRLIIDYHTLLSNRVSNNLDFKLIGMTKEVHHDRNMILGQAPLYIYFSSRDKQI